MTISALIIDDEQLARDELAYLLEAAPDVDVVAQGANGIEAVELIEIHGITIRHNHAVESDEEAFLVDASHGSNVAQQPRAFRDQQMRSAVRINIGCHHRDNRPDSCSREPVHEDRFDDRVFHQPVQFPERRIENIVVTRVVWLGCVEAGL